MRSLEKVIIGIDPGSVNTGYAIVLSQNNKKIKILDTGVLEFKSSEDFFKRLEKLFRFFSTLAQEHSSYDLAMESLIHVKNVSSLAKLSQARGAVLAALVKNAVDIREYSPNLIKSTVSGYGFSSKQSIEKSLKFIFPDKEFKKYDESDALAIALCHSFQGDKLDKTKKTKKSSSLKKSLSHLGKV